MTPGAGAAGGRSQPPPDPRAVPPAGPQRPEERPQDEPELICYDCGQPLSRCTCGDGPTPDWPD